MTLKGDVHPVGFYEDDHEVTWPRGYERVLSKPGRVPRERPAGHIAHGIDRNLLSGKVLGDAHEKRLFARLERHAVA